MRLYNNWMELYVVLFPVTNRSARTVGFYWDCDLKASFPSYYIWKNSLLYFKAEPSSSSTFHPVKYTVFQHNAISQYGPPMGRKDPLSIASETLWIKASTTKWPKSFNVIISSQFLLYWNVSPWKWACPGRWWWSRRWGTLRRGVRRRFRSLSVPPAGSEHVCCAVRSLARSDCEWGSSFDGFVRQLKGGALNEMCFRVHLFYQFIYK